MAATLEALSTAGCNELESSLATSSSKFYPKEGKRKEYIVSFCETTTTTKNPLWLSQRYHKKKNYKNWWFSSVILSCLCEAWVWLLTPQKEKEKRKRKENSNQYPYEYRCKCPSLIKCLQTDFNSIFKRLKGWDGLKWEHLTSWAPQHSQV